MRVAREGAERGEGVVGTSSVAARHVERKREGKSEPPWLRFESVCVRQSSRRPRETVDSLFATSWPSSSSSYDSCVHHRIFKYFKRHFLLFTIFDKFPIK